MLLYGRSGIPGGAPERQYLAVLSSPPQKKSGKPITHHETTSDRPGLHAIFAPADGLVLRLASPQLAEKTNGKDRY